MDKKAKQAAYHYEEKMAERWKTYKLTTTGVQSPLNLGNKEFLSEDEWHKKRTELRQTYLANQKIIDHDRVNLKKVAHNEIEKQLALIPKAADKNIFFTKGNEWKISRKLNFSTVFPTVNWKNGQKY